MRRLVPVQALALLLGAATAAPAQSTAAWAQRRAAELARQNLAAEQMDRDKDVEPPSLARGGSLVDQTDAPDLVSLGLSLYDAAAGTDSKAPAAVTISGWALRNAVTAQDPLDPAVYATGGAWRRWSVSVGRELDEGAGGAAQVVGAKVLAWNQRDVSSQRHRDSLDAFDALLPRAAKAIAAAVARIDDYLFQTLRTRVTPPLAGASEAGQRLDFINVHLSGPAFDNTLALLTDEERARLDSLLPDLAAVDEEIRERAEALVAGIRGAPQLAFAYQARLRSGTAADEHRWAAVFDYGPTDVLKLAVNGSFDLKRLPEVDDERGGRLAVELAWAAAGGASAASRAGEVSGGRRREDPSPLTVGVAGEVEWRSNRSAVRRLQGKLTLPIPALKGIALPISVTLASDPDLIDEHDVRGHVGFTLDFAQLRRALAPFAR